MAKSYYSLVAGLREFALESENKGFDLSSILEEIRESLSSSDWKAVELLYAFYDCENLVKLRSGASQLNSLGALSGEELEAELKSPEKFTGEVAKVIRAYANPDGEEAEDVDVSRNFAVQLFGAYYRMCASSSLNFIRDWSRFERNLRNVVAATVARQKGMALEDVVVGEDEVSEQIRRSSSPDFGLKAEFPYVEPVVNALTEEKNMLEKEHKIDVIKWDMASELSEFSYFDANAVLAYLVKVNIVARWIVLDKARGAEMFQKLLKEFNVEEKLK